MSSSSEDDVPLVKVKENGVVSSEIIPKSLDDKLDKAMPSNGHHTPAVLVRSGPLEMVEDKAQTNGAVNGNANAKRKSRGSLANGKTYKDASSSADEDEKPLSKRRKTKPVIESDSEMSDVPLANVKGKAVRPPKATAAQIGESDSDEPITSKLAKKKEQIEKSAAKTAKEIRAKEAASKKRKSKLADSDDDEPLIKKKAKSAPAPTPAKKEKPKAKPKTATVSPAKKGKGKEMAETEEDEGADGEEDEYQWWLNMDKDDNGVKWTTLEHNGVVFPPEYVPLPKRVKLVYDGVPVTLPPESEEVAGFYGAMLNSEVNVKNPTFNKNFFTDFKAVLDKTGHGKDKDGNLVTIKEFAKCNFQPIFDYYDEERLKKKNLPAAEKKALKAAKDEAEAPYMYCTWDGRKQKVGNFRVEPPGLFRGRGEHPKTGHLKTRVQPEQITINIGKGVTPPAPPEGHEWAKIQHDNTATWLAMWQENINRNYKYVMLAASSDIKGQSDYTKFEKARALKKYIDIIRKDYKAELKDKVMANRQRATAMYFIDELALRAGNEKGDDEADTVGCCSLKCENVSTLPDFKLEFDFLGKDSIPFQQVVVVDPQVYKNIQIFKRNKEAGDNLFDRLSTAGLNKHLHTYMPGLTAKVFRTYNASHTMSNLLQNMDDTSTGNIPDLIKKYNDANRQVALICNHKRTVAAGHAGSMEKMVDKIKGMRYQLWRLKQMILDVEPKMKKKRGAEFFERPEDITDEWVLAHQVSLVEAEREKIRKKFAKDNEKLEAEGKKPMKEKDLAPLLEKAAEMDTKFKKENKSKKVEAEGASPTVDKLQAKIDTLEARIAASTLQLQDKDDNKEVALGTSKINYIDPRLTVVFTKKFNVPIEKFFSKTLREKFDWAIKSVDADWQF